MTNNDKDLELLKSDPKAIIVHYQDIIEIIVTKYIRARSIHKSDKEEFIQIINERLLLSIEKIRIQYKGISSLKTYFSVIIKNICLEEINKQNKYCFIELETNYSDIFENKADENSYLQDEFDRLSKILVMYNTKAAKLTLCLKVIFRLKVRITDFTKYCLKFNTHKIRQLIDAVNPIKMIPEFELFQILTPYINKCDNQRNQPDTLRKWFKRKLDELVELMNGKPRRANYDKETIQILCEKYYSKKFE